MMDVKRSHADASAPSTQLASRSLVHARTVMAATQTKIHHANCWKFEFTWFVFLRLT
jgi:hypothetical protein